MCHYNYSSVNRRQLTNEFGRYTTLPSPSQPPYLRTRWRYINLVLLLVLLLLTPPRPGVSSRLFPSVVKVYLRFYSQFIRSLLGYSYLLILWELGNGGSGKIPVSRDHSADDTQC